MLRFSNVLLVLGGGSPGQCTALQRAVFVARTHRASLSVAGLVRPPCPESRDARQAQARDISAAVVQACQETVEHVVEPFRGAPVSIATAVLCGTPFQEIIREVVRGGHDLVMIAADSRSGIRNALFGTTSQHLLRKCPCPVWLLKQEERIPYRRVLAAVDPTCDEPEKTALHRRILGVSAAIAGFEHSELHVAHAWNVEFERVLRTRLPRPAMRSLLRETRQRREAALWQLAAPFVGSKPHQVHLRKGEPRDVLPLLARRKDVDLIVMGTACRTGFRAFLAGNTAEQVLETVDCSLLAIKPEGFVTPVRLEQRESLDRVA